MMIVHTGKNSMKRSEACVQKNGARHNNYRIVPQPLNCSFIVLYLQVAVQTVSQLQRSAFRAQTYNTSSHKPTKGSHVRHTTAKSPTALWRYLNYPNKPNHRPSYLFVQSRERNPFHSFVITFHSLLSPRTDRSQPAYSLSLNSTSSFSFPFVHFGTKLVGIEPLHV